MSKVKVEVQVQNEQDEKRKPKSSKGKPQETVNEKARKKEERKNKALDKIHRKKNAVSFLEPIDYFAVYAMDMRSLNNTDHRDFVKRGILKFDTQKKWADFIHENKEDCEGFRPIKGVDLATKHIKVLTILRNKARLFAKQDAK